MPTHVDPPTCLPAYESLHPHLRFKEEGAATIPFDITDLNGLDRFDLVTDLIDRVPQSGDTGIYLKQQPES